MRKQYPYLEESYSPDLNEEQEKRHFLSQINDFVNQRQYINMTLLDWEENPLKEIDGIITSGSISKNGASSVRRTCSLSCSVNGEEYNVDSLEMDFSLNKKIFIEIGVKNDTDKYPDYPILWFPQGVFYIDSISFNSSTTSAVNINLNLKDKMCLLNGDVGGTLPATVQFDTMTTQLSTGEFVTQKVLIYSMILELVNHWGEEELSNIVIEDVPLRIRRIVKWDGTNPIYCDREVSGTSADSVYTFSLDKVYGWEEYERGRDIGYVYDDFVSTKEIIGSAGDSVCTVLDEIKNMLGNYEYFYDVFGIFHFREIKNYLNITQAEIALEHMSNPGRHYATDKGQFLLDENSEIQYLIETTNEKTVYSFSDNHNITSITVTPNYQNIRNDYVICGLKPGTTSDIKYDLRFRIAIDDKPEIVERVTAADLGRDTGGTVGSYGTYENVIYYTDEADANLNKLGFYEFVTALPDVGNFDKIYQVQGESGFEYYRWVSDMMYRRLYVVDDDCNEIEPYVYDKYPTLDWRTFLYLYGMQANDLGTDPGPYFADLQAFWPLEYDLRREKQHFFGQDGDTVHFNRSGAGVFYFDMIDASSSSLGEYSVSSIGRRTDVVHDDDVNCLFTPEIPNVIFLNADNPNDNWSENTMIKNTTDPSAKLALQREECIANNQPYTQVSQEIYSNLITGGYSNGAFESLKYELFCHTRYQKVVSITSLPVFFLEPNSRVELNDRSTNTYGDFMVQSVNLTLGPGANMSVSLNEVAERL